MQITHLARRLTRSFVRGVVLVTVVATSSLATVSASGTTEISPHTIVADDGTVYESATPSAATGLSEATADAGMGSGELAPEADQAVSLDGDAALAATPQQAEPNAIETGSTYVDTRYPISYPAAYPNSMMVLLTLQNGGYSYRCSGFMISPNTVATAGHCLHFNGAWSYNVRAYPGYTGYSAPYGSCAARQLYSVHGWVTSKNGEYDYGVIKLDCTVGYSTGWFGFRWQSASLDGLPVRIQGYPVDKGWGQWGHNGSVSYSYLRNTLSSYTIGFNGAPIFDNAGYAVSIYNTTGARPPVCSGGVCQTTSAIYSWGTRITEEVFNNLLYWRSL